jgi:protein gp37
MSATTKIQWCDSTCNPTMGCEGCELWNPKTGERSCYAGVLHMRYGGVTKGFSPTFEELTFWPGRMAAAARWRDLAGACRKDKPWLDGLPRIVFVSDMSDALSGVVPFDYLEEEIVQTVTQGDGQRHQWLWLTKRPDRMATFSDAMRASGVQWPDNLWAGTSVTTQGTTVRIDHLLRVGDERTIRFLSVEPQREQITLAKWLPRLDWAIQGGESGPSARTFELEWAVDLIRQCKTAGVAYFLKQLGSAVYAKGKRLRFRDGHAGDWSEWPSSVRLRQMPKRIREKRPPPAAARSNPPRLSLDLVDADSNGRRAALKAWKTRRENARMRAVTKS